MLAHNDNKLNLLRLIAFGAVGIYLYNVYKKQGNMKGVLGSPNSELRINTDKVIEYVLPFIDVPPQYKEAIKIGAKEALKGYFDKKGIKT
jgi:hypothetical protein